MAFQSHGNGCHLRQRMRGREFVQGLPIKSEEGMEGNPILLADSVSLDEQKAKGDVKKKGRLDPYAYIPLNRTKLNHRYGTVQGWWGA